ncbi:MAG: hypothetical protein K0V04_03345 [Deltaproteobacteria bacterium]|nr:hypothetical protein [Deltaproteobacteria bacterium]
MILILSTRDDPHARLVLEELQARGVASTLVDAAELGSEHTITVSYPGGATWTRADGETIDLSAVRCLWFRRLRFPTLQMHPLLQHRRFVLDEWKELITGLFLSMEATVINELRHQIFCPKGLQLREASRVGLRVPSTIMTNDAASVSAFSRELPRGVVHKAFRPMGRRSLDTRVLEPEHLEALDSLYLAPVIFQERIDKRADVRVMWVDGRVFAVAFEADDEQIDSRLNIDAPWDVIELPAEIELRIAALMGRLGLRIAALDLVIDEHGGFVFLEVNPQGQFLYLEILTGLPITRAVADLLIAAAAEGAVPRTRAGSMEALP